MAGTWLKKKAGVIETSSKLRMYWLRMFRGYDVVERIREPQSASFGRIVYKDTWLLQPGDSEDSEG